MKQLILLLLFFPLFSLGQTSISSFADYEDRVAIDVLPGPKNTHQILGLNGNVKSIKVTFYNATEKFGKPEKEDFLKYYEIKFDIEGNPSEYRYKQFDSINFEYKYKYDNAGNLIEEREEEMFHSKYIYDKNGYNTEIYEYDSDDDLSRVHKMEYDKFGNILVKTRYNPNGDFIDSYEYFYSDNGKILYRTQKRNWRKIIEKQITYSYDKSNQYNMKYLCIWNQFSGDVNGDLLPMSECEITESKQYDYEGKLIKWTRFPNTPDNTEMLTQEELFYYDFKNYDKKNNWTLKIYVENDWVKLITEREIEYYN